MPGFDGTGPRGQGPMTGGARGYCAAPLAEGIRPFFRKGFYNRGGGRGWRNCFYVTGLPGWLRTQRVGWAFSGFGQPQLKDKELADLKNQANFLKAQLDAVVDRIKELEGNQEEGK